MTDLFEYITDITEFEKKFSNNKKCLEFLANKKWKDGFICKKCGNTNYCNGKTYFSRRCTKCKYEESATSHTIFHNCKIPLSDAFLMTYLVCSSHKISTYELSRKVNIRQMTCWKLKKKIMECINNRKDLTFFEKLEIKKNI